MSASYLKPELYAATAEGTVLLGGRCQCGHVFFPMQRFGCEYCGRSGSALVPYALRGSGLLKSWTTVYLYGDQRHRTPFKVGVIALDEGPVIRALLADMEFTASDQPRVHAVLEPVPGTDGSPVFDLRFRLSESARDSI